MPSLPVIHQEWILGAGGLEKIKTNIMANPGITISCIEFSVSIHNRGNQFNTFNFYL